MHRPTVAVLALVLLAAGVVVYLVTGEDGDVWASVLIRVGAVLGAVWLVLPQARDVSRPIWFGIGAFVLIVAVRPRLILWALLAAAVVAVLAMMARGRARASGEP